MAGGEGLSIASVLKEFKDLLTPEMIRALSPTEGFEAKPHTFQAVETEGRWKKPPDWPTGDPRLLSPPSAKVKKSKLLEPCKATILTIDFRPIDFKWIQTILETLLSSVAPAPIQLATTALRGQMKNLMSPKGPLGQLLPSLSRALTDLLKPSTAEIEAIWWSDGFEIWAGQAAAKHVTGFGSLFGHQARVELDGVPFGNYFPASYCLTFTGFVNPVGPIFEELRGAVQLLADGRAVGMFCERSNRDKKEPESIDFSSSDGYVFKY